MKKPKVDLNKIRDADDKIAVSSKELIKSVMYFIEAILIKHETAVVEIMFELKQENEMLKQRIANLECGK